VCSSDLTSFTPETKIGVNVQLVTANTLLPSVLAGKGPDVAIGLAGGDPINYAVRNAVRDISGFKDFDEIVKRFQPSAMVPFTFNGGAYALPETQSFSMMFYRTDIFNELNIKPPETWEDMELIIPELQKKNMTIGLPKDLGGLMLMMSQMDAPLYLDNGARTNLDSPEAARAFKRLTEYFTLFKFPTEYDFPNRFRSGEMPIGIADYTLYNQLSLFAPEIRGHWAMAPVPGTRRTKDVVLKDGVLLGDCTVVEYSTVADNGKPNHDGVVIKEDVTIEGCVIHKAGTVNHATPAGGSAVSMLRGVRDEEAAWEFMKWWTSAPIQARFANEMETVMSGAARQPTANMEALELMSWSVRDYRSIVDQWDNVVGIPEVPGGYFTTRVVGFAFSRVYNNRIDPAESLQFYVDSLNAELSRKRQEFGL
jgi:ABC-type glycerol-3-phosphate transport system substrate-binding protein